MRPMMRLSPYIFDKHLMKAQKSETVLITCTCHKNITIPIKISRRIEYIIKFQMMQILNLPVIENSPTDASPEIIGNPMNPIIMETQYYTRQRIFSVSLMGSSGSDSVTEVKETY